MRTGPTVGLIGLGRMGAAMAARFAACGHSLWVWNRTPAKAAQVAATTGAAVAASPAELTAEVDLVISSLADDAALSDVYLGAAGVVAGAGADTVVVDTSTVHPATIRQVGAALDGAGAAFLDCPVSGSVPTVEQGALVMMAGGAAETVARVATTLAAIAKEVVHVGGRGAGAACKLAVNALVHGLNIALSEALVLAEKAGVDREQAYRVFANGAAGAPFVHYKQEAYLRPWEAPVAFTLDLVEKDLELITALGAEVGASLRQAETGLGIVRSAIERGMGQRDLSAVAEYLREQGRG